MFSTSAPACVSNFTLINGLRQGTATIQGGRMGGSYCPSLAQDGPF